VAEIRVPGELGTKFLRKKMKCNKTKMAANDIEKFRVSTVLMVIFTV